MVLLDGVLAALPRRATSSATALDMVLPVLILELAAVAREAAHETRQTLTTVVKACEGEAEREKVCGEQLEAYALLFEGLVAGDAWLLDHTPIQLALTLARASPSLLPPLFVACMPTSAAALWSVVDDFAAVWAFVLIRAPTGTGLLEFDAGDDADGAPLLNSLSFACVDASGEAVTSVEESDVCVVVEGGAVSSVTANGGVAEVRYSVPADRVAPVTLRLFAFGRPLPGSPWTVQVWSLSCPVIIPSCRLCCHGYFVCDCMIGLCAYLQPPALHRSPILCSVPTDIRAGFLRLLATEWWPHKKFDLLYSGARDRMTPHAFHKRCNRKGPTLTLIRSGGYVFGGYTTANWGDGSGEFRICVHSFLFAVVAHGGSLAKFPIFPDCAMKAIRCNDCYGPCFGEGADLILHSHKGENAIFDERSYSRLGKSYQDTLGLGASTFTGSPNFVPDAVEVYLERQGGESRD